MSRYFIQYKSFILLTAVIIAIFLTQTLLAVHFTVPRLNDIFTILTLLGVMIVVLENFCLLQRRDWVSVIFLGVVVASGMFFATLFTPYPFLGIVRSNPEQALVRGLSTTLAAVGGMVISRRGGPVQLHAANGNWRKTLHEVLIGLIVGIPLAILNVVALKISQGSSISWQNPLSALVDALQPAIVEEVIYRFALWSLLWVVLNKSVPEKAVWLSGVLAMLVHNYQHFDDLFLQSPLMAIGMGIVMVIFWGIPPLILARRRGLESAIAFHWIQDVARFVTGF